MLDGVCEDTPVAMPKKDTRRNEMTRTLRRACDSFIELFYDDISSKLYNNFASVVNDVCGPDVVGACKRDDLLGLDLTKLGPAKRDKWTSARPEL